MNMTSTHAHRPTLARSRRPLIAAGTSALVAAALLVPSLAGAQTLPPPLIPKADGQWYGNLSAGASFQSGATRSTSFNVDGDGTRITAQDKINVYGNYLRAQTKKDDTSIRTGDLARIGGRYQYNLSERLYGYGTAEALRNGVIDIRSQYAGGGGVGYKLYNTPNFSFDVFGGAGYVKTNYFENPSISGWELQFGEEMTWGLSPTAALKQRAVIYPSLSNSGDYRATFDGSLLTTITGRLGLKLSVGAVYYSAPPPGLRSVSSLVTVGLNYSLDPR